MLVSNNRYQMDEGLASNWVLFQVYQTLIFENVSLFVETGLALPNAPRIGEKIEIYGSMFAGQITDITYQAHYNSFYEDNPRTSPEPKDLPHFNDCTIRIKLADAVSNHPTCSDDLIEARLDKSYTLSASKKCPSTDLTFSERLKLIRNDTDYLRKNWIDVYNDLVPSFDAEAFDKEYCDWWPN
jgi:hypothetical protein